MYSKGAMLVLAMAVAAKALPLPDISSSAIEQEVMESPQPYSFGFEFGDGFGMVQHRKETADGNGLVQGSYGYVGDDGLYRKVEYTADSNGYRAVIKSNEPGLSNQNSADASFIVESPPPEVLAKQIINTSQSVVAEV